MSLPEKIKQSKGIVVYFKNDHCPPCKALRPKIKALVEKSFPKMDFTIVDTEKTPQLAGKFNIFANPTIIVFFDGKEHIRKSKYIAIKELEKEISRLYTLMFD